MTAPGVTPVLAGALAASPVRPAAGGLLGARRHPAGRGPLDAADDLWDVASEAVRRDPLGWWGAYVDRVAPPVLEAYFRHGVVLEPHLQNVLVGRRSRWASGGSDIP